MKKIPYLIVLLAVLSPVACRRAPVVRPDTVPLVKTLAADSTFHLSAPDVKGCIAILGNTSDAEELALRFTTADSLDNIDGKMVPDALLDFAGETFKLLSTKARSQMDEQGRREYTVYQASRIIRQDSECQPKMYVLASEGLTPFDLDTLYKMAGFRVDIVTADEGDLVLATAKRLRSSNLYTHRISLPQLQYVQE